jgi:hypothetical protein
LDLGVKVSLHKLNVLCVTNFRLFGNGQKTKPVLTYGPGVTNLFCVTEKQEVLIIYGGRCLSLLVKGMN